MTDHLFPAARWLGSHGHLDRTSYASHGSKRENDYESQMLELEGALVALLQPSHVTD